MYNLFRYRAANFPFEEENVNREKILKRLRILYESNRRRTNDIEKLRKLIGNIDD
jgi:hypothetical protein